MNLVFIGASRFGLRCLDLVTQLHAVHVVGVVTAPQTFSISYRPEGVTNVLHADVASYCEVKGLPCATIENGMKAPVLYRTVSSWSPDAFLVVGWYHMIPRNWRSLAPAYGLHASLLPDYSGGAPLVWAMINGEKKTGITLFQMDDGVDSGPIVGQADEVILESDTIKTLYDRIEDRGLELLRGYLPDLALARASFRAQDESRRRIFPQRSPGDGLIDWEKSALEIDRFIRAQTRPYPGAFTIFDDRRLTLWNARTTAEMTEIGLAPGQYRLVGDSVLVGCGGETVLCLDRLEWGGQDIEAATWFTNVGQGRQYFCSDQTNRQDG